MRLNLQGATFATPCKAGSETDKATNTFMTMNLDASRGLT